MHTLNVARYSQGPLSLMVYTIWYYFNQEEVSVFSIFDSVRKLLFVWKLCSLSLSVCVCVCVCVLSINRHFLLLFVMTSNKKDFHRFWFMPMGWWDTNLVKQKQKVNFVPRWELFYSTTILFSVGNAIKIPSYSKSVLVRFASFDSFISYCYGNAYELLVLQIGIVSSIGCERQKAMVPVPFKIVGPFFVVCVGPNVLCEMKAHVQWYSMMEVVACCCGRCWRRHSKPEV